MTKRLLAALLGCLIFIFFGVLVAIVAIDSDTLVSRDIAYQLPFDQTISEAQILIALEDQKQILQSLAISSEVQWPISRDFLLDNLKFSLSTQPPTIHVSMQCDSRINLISPFDQWIKLFQNQTSGLNGQNPSVWMPSNSLPINATLDKENKKFENLLISELKKEFTSQKQVTKEKMQLQLKLNRLQSELIMIERGVNDINFEDNEDFKTYLQPYLLQSYSNHHLLLEYEKTLKLTRDQKNALDILAGKETSVEGLAAIESERNKRQLDIIMAQHEIETIKQTIDQKIKTDHWPIYKRIQKNKIYEYHKMVVGFKDQLNVKEKQLLEIAIRISLHQAELHKLNPTKARFVNLEAGSPTLMIQNPLAATQTKTVFGQLQLYLIAVTGFFGAVVGLLVGWSKYPQNRLKKQNVSKNPFELEPVIIERPMTHPLTESKSYDEVKSVSDKPKPKAPAKNKPVVSPGLAKKPVERPSKKTQPKPLPDDNAKVDKEPALTSLQSEPIKPVKKVVPKKEAPKKEPAPKPEPPKVIAKKPEPKIETKPESDKNIFDPNSDSGTEEQCDVYADMIDALRSRTKCPFIIVTAANAKEISPRFQSQLAITLQKRQQRVLMIEADESSSIWAQEVFNVPVEPGFFEWRCGQAWVSQVTHDTHLRDVVFMPAGKLNAQQGTDDLDLSKERHRWDNLKNSFDVVLLYSPNVLAAKAKQPHQKAAKHLLEMADGVFILTKSRGIEKLQEKYQLLLTERPAELLSIINVKK